MGNALRSQSAERWADLVLIAAGLATGILAYAILFPENYALLTTDELVGGFLVSLLTFWAALRLWASWARRLPHCLPIFPFWATSASSKRSSPIRNRPIF